MLKSLLLTGRHVLRNGLVVYLLLVGHTLTDARAQAAIEVSVAVEQELDQPRLAGQGQLRYFGLRIYQARLWVGPQFSPGNWDAHPLALELTYQRSFSAESIAERSVQEIERLRPLSAQQKAAWITQLAQWLSDVKAGDNVTGVYMPGRGMQLWSGERAQGTLDDPELALSFFAIWLSPRTSQPGLREDLLAQAEGV